MRFDPLSHLDGINRIFPYVCMYIFTHFSKGSKPVIGIGVRGTLKQEPSDGGFEYCFEYFKDKAHAHSLQ